MICAGSFNFGAIPADVDIDVEKYVQAARCAGGEGLTPGYWKQSKHFDDWNIYQPSDSFDAVFGVDAPGNATLLSALQNGGGGSAALMRHAAAALLDAVSPDVDYLYNWAQVVQIVQNAFATGKFEAAKNLLEAQNELGLKKGDGCCPDDGAGYGMDADSPSGPSIKIGDKALFTYVVTNPGDYEIGNVTLVDDNATPLNPLDDFAPTPVLGLGGFNIGDADKDGRLDAGETWLFIAQTTVTCGKHVNVATVSGAAVNAVGQIISSAVTDSDAAWWKGVTRQNDRDDDCKGHGKRDDDDRQHGGKRRDDRDDHRGYGQDRRC
jgi:hypothetical protein